MARSTSLLPHHIALAVAGEGNKGGSGGRESTLFFLWQGAREGNLLYLDNCYTYCKELICPEF
jgi:hypothetical protein